MEEPQNPRYKACLDLFIRHNGRNLCLIEREMRALGFADFSRRILYGRKEDGKYKPGWIEKYAWKKHLERPHAGNAGAPACMSAKHEHPSSTRDLHKPAPPKPGNIAVEGAYAPDRDFPDWLKQVSPEMTWHWKHQRFIYKHLQKVTTGESKRLMIFLPPRHGKSELVTVRYAGWRLWNDPKMRIIVSSYNQKLADKFSRSIRRLLSEEEDKRRQQVQQIAKQVASGPERTETEVRSGRNSPVCDTKVLTNPVMSKERMFPPSRTINTTSQWETAVGGGVKAVGVGAGVTGFGAQLVIIDDPVKNRAEAESETYRERIWDWYRNDLYTRLEPNASIVLIQTRWHEDDLAGRLLNEMQNGGDQWDVVNLPALAERSTAGNAGPRNPRSAIHDPQSIDPLDRQPGEALCPQRFDEPALDDIRRQLGGYAFSALYQQRPTPAEGGIFKRAWFKHFVDHAPDGLKWKRGYDLAVSTKTSACYTSSFRVAYDRNGNLYIAEGFRRRIEFPEQRRYIVSRLVEERDTEHGVEKALHGDAIIQDLRRDPSIRGTILRGVTVTADKVTRALKWAPLAEEGKVILVRGPWNQAFLDEVCSFPGGQYDDQVDAVSLAVAMFEQKGGRIFTF